MPFDRTIDRCKRRDMQMFILVEAACFAYSDPRKAAEYMAGKGVPFEVTHRVLVHPNRRRGMCK